MVLHPTLKTAAHPGGLQVTAAHLVRTPALLLPSCKDVQTERLQQPVVLPQQHRAQQELPDRQQGRPVRQIQGEGRHGGTQRQIRQADRQGEQMICLSYSLFVFISIYYIQCTTTYYCDPGLDSVQTQKFNKDAGGHCNQCGSGLLELFTRRK